MKKNTGILLVLILGVLILGASVYAAEDNGSTQANPEDSGYNPPDPIEDEPQVLKEEPKEQGFFANIAREVSSVFKREDKKLAPKSQMKNKSEQDMRIEPTVFSTVEGNSSQK